MSSDDNTSSGKLKCIPSPVDQRRAMEVLTTAEYAPNIAEHTDGGLAEAQAHEHGLCTAFDPMSEQIRKQVDHYFSDENLIEDEWLLGKLRGRKNCPVSVEKIYSCFNMQKYEGISRIIYACRDACENVNLVQTNGVWSFQRKTAFIKEDVYAARGIPLPRNKKSTGFEHAFKETILGNEAEEEKRLYDPSNSFAERIEVAIQRYYKRRRMNNARKNVFEKLLAFGGCEAGPNAFSGGLDKDCLDSHKADEIDRFATRVSIGNDKGDGASHEWIPDFEAVISGWLSSYVQQVFYMADADQFELVIDVTRNFICYLQVHKVCVEYDEQLRNALSLCDQAEFQIPRTLQAGSAFPGTFNIACSVKYGGVHKIEVDNGWSPEFASLGNETDGLAQKIFATAVTYFAPTVEPSLTGSVPNPMEWELMAQDIVSIERDTGLEVCRVERAKPATVKFYDCCNVVSQGRAILQPLGKLYCRSWHEPTHSITDRPPFAPSVESKLREYCFLMEDNLLEQSCFEGMKMTATVYTLSHGWAFFDNVTSVRCSFYTLLDNELLLSYKPFRHTTREERLELLKRQQLEYFGLSDAEAEEE